MKSKIAVLVAVFYTRCLLITYLKKKTAVILDVFFGCIWLWNFARFWWKLCSQSANIEVVACCYSVRHLVILVPCYDRKLRLKLMWENNVKSPPAGNGKGEEAGLFCTPPTTCYQLRKLVPFAPAPNNKSGRKKVRCVIGEIGPRTHTRQGVVIASRVACRPNQFVLFYY